MRRGDVVSDRFSIERRITSGPTSELLLASDEVTGGKIALRILLAEAADYPNVIVGRTFSKAFGLAGMRVGVMIAAPEILAPIRRCMPLFNLNVVAVAALRAAIKDPSFREWYIAQANESKQLVYAACDRSGLKYWKSSTNFVLIDGGSRVREIVDGMIAKGVFVRDRTKDPSTPTCFRLTTGVVEHTRKACDTLEALCASLR